MKKTSHGGKRPNAGRKPPEVQKVRLSTWVLPSTKAALGSKPGERLDTDYRAMADLWILERKESIE